MAASRGTRLEAIPGAPPRLDRLPPGCAFAPRCRLVEPVCTVGDIPAIALGPERSARCVKLAVAGGA